MASRFRLGTTVERLPILLEILTVLPEEVHIIMLLRFACALCVFGTVRNSLKAF